MAQQVMTWWLFSTLATVGVYDVYAIMFIGGNSTVSHAIYHTGRQWPTLYLLLGLLIGHVIFPLHVYHSEGPPAINGKGK